MAVTKRTPATKKQPVQARAVPVRVVKASAPRPRPVPVVRPTAATTSTRRRSGPSRQGPQADGDRRVAMWSGVILAAAIIFVLWIAIVRIDLSQPSSADTLFGRLRTELQDLFSSKSKNANTNAADQELNQLRNQVFPNINEGTFTTDGNDNANSNPLNTNATNTNSPLNMNTNS